MNRLFISVLIFSAYSWQAAGQAPDVRIPHAPLVATPLPGTSWEIAIKFEKGKDKDKEGEKGTNSVAQGDRLPTRITMKQGTAVSRTVLSWSDGSVTEAYVQHGSAFLRNGPSGESGPFGAVQVISAEEDEHFPVFTTGYPGTAWLELKDFQTVEKLAGEDCFKYVKPRGALRWPADEAKSPELIAWIRIEDKIPVRIQIGPMIYEYSPIKPSPGQVVLPDAVHDYIQQLERENKALELMKKQHTPG